MKSSRRSLPVTLTIATPARLVLLSALAALLAGKPAHAQYLTYQFTGVVSESFSSAVDVGDPLQGTFTYSLHEPDDHNDPNIGRYSYWSLLDGSSPIGMSFTAGSYIGSSVGHSQWEVNDDQPSLGPLLYPSCNGQCDAFRFDNIWNLYQSNTLTLVDRSGIAFDSDASPASLNLGDFSVGEFEAWADGRTFIARIDALDLIATQPPLPPRGDFNQDGVVNAADYVVWRDALGQSGAGLAADVTGQFIGLPDGIVDEHDYTYWKSRFGTTDPMSVMAFTASSLPTSVPEPSAFAITCVAALSIGSMRFRGLRRSALLHPHRMGQCVSLYFTWAIALLPISALADSEIRYHITDLSEFVGPNRTARAINEAGQVVGGPAGGSASVPTPGYVWDPTDGVVLLENTPPLVYVGAINLNDSGQVVGTAVGGVLVPVQHAFVWQEATGLADIGTLSGPTSLAQGYGINDSGLVVGTARDLFGDVSQAFVWTSDAGIRPLDGLRSANAVNNAGQIVGQGLDPTPDDDSLGPHATLFDPVAGVIDLGTVLNNPTSVATDLNENGEVVGSSGPTAFHWQNGVITPLELGSFSSTSATSINIEGTIVGYGIGTGRVALLWDGGTQHQLNDLIDPALGWHLEYASDVNDQGQIVGWGTRVGFGTSFRAFLLTPMAEPDASGDHNDDGIVNAADYVHWRDQIGLSGGYNTWRANFGQTLGDGSMTNASVPEPTSLVLLLLATVPLLKLPRLWKLSRVA